MNFETNMNRRSWPPVNTAPLFSFSSLVQNTLNTDNNDNNNNNITATNSISAGDNSCDLNRSESDEEYVDSPSDDTSTTNTTTTTNKTAKQNKTSTGRVATGRRRYVANPNVKVFIVDPAAIKGIYRYFSELSQH